MLWTIAVILLVLWALGLVTSTSMGGLIHILLVVAVSWCSSICCKDDGWRKGGNACHALHAPTH
jgi:hypothetical protein